MHKEKQICAQMKLGIDTMMNQLMQMRARVEDIESKLVSLESTTKSKADVSTSALGNGQDAINTRILNNIARNVARRNH